MEKKVLIGISKTGDNYSARAPAIPGCFATGKTTDEARERLIYSLGEHIKGMIEDGEFVPSVDEYYGVVDVPLTDFDKKHITGGTLRSYRKKLGLTQAELAEMLEVTKETISDWERGIRDLPGTVKFALAK